MFKKINFKLVAKYFSSLVLFLIFSYVSDVKSLKLSVLCGFLYNGFSPFTLSVLYIFSNLYKFELVSFLTGVCECVILCVCFALYRGKKPKAEVIIYVLLSLCPYVFSTPITIEKAVYTAIIVVFCFVSESAVKFLYDGGLSYRPCVEEVTSLAIFSCGVGVGVINLTDVFVWKCIALYLILAVGYLYLDGTATLFAFIFSLPVALSLKTFEPIGVYCLYACVTLVFLSKSKLIASCVAVMTELALVYLTNIYDSYSYLELILFLSSITAFILTPKSFLDCIKERVFVFKEKRLTRHVINRMRLSLSDKLFEVSSVFKQTGKNLADIKLLTPSEDDVLDKIATCVLNEVCAKCPMRVTCAYKNFPQTETLEKLAKIGLAKGKLILVDIPSDFCENCSYVNNVLYEFNRKISSYSETLAHAKTFSEESDVMSLQAKTLAFVTKELALSCGKTLSFSSATESKIFKALRRAGINTGEIMCFGSGETCEVNVVVEKSCYDEAKFSSILSSCVGFDLFPSSVTHLSQVYLCVNYKKAPLLDAVFGVKQVCKKGNSLCGDTHSLFKINEGKFVIALNDGMGSGKRAREVSDATLNLLENFFKSGMDCEITLKMLNKIISISSPDTFTALDLCLVDMYNSTAQFIKIGAPYGYLLEKTNVKIIEGSSLPLGIVDDLKTLSATSPVLSGDILVLVTDGVTDAFGSSMDLLDYLKTLSCKNPQSLADKIIDKALSLSGEAKDDMTALCVKLFERNAHFFKN